MKKQKTEDGVGRVGKAGGADRAGKEGGADRTDKTGAMLDRKPGKVEDMLDGKVAAKVIRRTKETSENVSDGTTDDTRDERMDDTSEEISDSASDDPSDNASDDPSEETAPLVLKVVEGRCAGSDERIALLITQIRTVSAKTTGEKEREAIFSGILTRTETDMLEEEPWVTSFLSLVPYEEISGAIYPQVRKKVEEVVKSGEERKKLAVLVSGRFRNVPDDAVYEMYASLSRCMKLEKGAKVLFLSAERAISSEEEKELQKMFPRLDVKALKKMLPENPEELFFSAIKGSGSKNPQVFHTSSGDVKIKGYLLEKEDIEMFLKELREYFDE